MKVKILVLLNLVFIGLAIFLFFRTKDYEQDIEFEQQRYQAAADSLQYYRYVSKGDSLMMAEDFEGAMEYFRLADNIYGEDRLVQDMEMVADGARAKTENIARLRQNLSIMREDMLASRDSLEEELHARDSLMNVQQSEISLLAYRNEIMRDSLSRTQAAYQDMQAREDALGKAEFMSSTGVKVYYAGELERGRAQGQGYGLFATGGIYEGEWKNNMRHGEGKYIWKDGNVYIGEYQDDKRQGTGTYYFSSGEKYVGEWENNVRSGQGTLYGNEGEIVLSGQWKNDQIVQVESRGGYQSQK